MAPPGNLGVFVLLERGHPVLHNTHIHLSLSSSVLVLKWWFGGCSLRFFGVPGPQSVLHKAGSGRANTRAVPRTTSQASSCALVGWLARGIKDCRRRKKNNISKKWPSLLLLVKVWKQRDRIAGHERIQCPHDLERPLRVSFSRTTPPHSEVLMSFDQDMQMKDRMS